MFGESDTLKRSDTTAVTRLLNLFPDAVQSFFAEYRGQLMFANSDHHHPAPLLQTPQRRIIFLDHSSRHQAAFVFRDDDCIGGRVANRVCIALLAGARDDLCLGAQRAGGDRDVKIVGVTVDHDANAARPLNTGLHQNIVPLGVALDHQHTGVQQLTAEPLVGLDQHKRNLQAGELVDYRPAYLTVSADDEMILELRDVGVVDHGFPSLQTLPVEDRDQYPLRDPHLKCEHSHVHENRKQLCRSADRTVIDRMRMKDPKECVNGAEPLQPNIDRDAYQTEPSEHECGQPQPPEKKNGDAAHKVDAAPV